MTKHSISDRNDTQCGFHLVFGIPAGGETITVRIYKHSDTLSAEVKNSITNQVVMSVPLASLSNITKLVETIAQHLSANAAARALLSPPSEPAALSPVAAWPEKT